MSAIMHMDGCHFFIWVSEQDGKHRLDWDERTGTSLFLYGRSDCARCSALRNGAEPASVSIEIDPLPLDGKAAFARILEVIAADERMIA